MGQNGCLFLAPLAPLLAMEQNYRSASRFPEQQPDFVPQVNVCLIVQKTVPSLTLIIEGMSELVTHHHPNPPEVQSPENTEQGLRFFSKTWRAMPVPPQAAESITVTGH